MSWTYLRIDIGDETYICPMSYTNGVACSHYKYWAGLMPLGGWTHAKDAVKRLIEWAYEQQQCPRGVLLAYLVKDAPGGFLGAVGENIEEAGGKPWTYPGFEQASVLRVDRPFSEIWKNVYDTKTRNMVRKAEKGGVECRQADIAEHLEDVVACTLSQPVRHGSRLPEYYYEAEAYGEMMATQREFFGDAFRSFGAFLDGRLVGYLNTFDAGREVICNNMLAHTDGMKVGANNALFAHATEFCCGQPEAERMTYSFFGTEGVDKFKKSMGFEPWEVKRFWLPFRHYNYARILMAMNAQRANYVTVDDALAGRLSETQPNVCIRHDVDFHPGPALRVLKAETQFEARSTFYLFPSYRNPEDSPAGYTEAVLDKLAAEGKAGGWGFGYHVGQRRLEDAVRDIDLIERRFPITSAVPHSGYADICRDWTNELPPLLMDGRRFLTRADGYVADNAGRISRLTKPETTDGKWFLIDVMRAVEKMEPGKLYHYSLHPWWWDERMDFREQP